VRFSPLDVKERLADLDQFRRRLFAGLDNDSDVTLGIGVEITEPPKLRVGEGVEIRSHVRIRGAVSIGDNSSIREYTLLDARDGSIEIGANCSVNDYCVIYGHGGVIIGDDVRMATHIVVVAADHRFNDPNVPIRKQGVEPKRITIGDDVWIGANACILGGVEIGRGCVIGAGSVVAESLEPFSVVVGNPARVVKKRGE
jgi:acetyltransferase-like isoleucine patch superfamily enzyme